jgi:2-polyprenyl-3-methyl-5-hydroxy-6-metoxy-1,4-benzoquinol methylase
MKPSEVGEGYDQIAEIWNSDAFNRLNGMEQHERALTFCHRKRHALDIGCGSSGRIVELLLGEGFDVEGVDVSRRMVELARQRHPEVPVHLADICEWTFPRQYDFISAWDSIWHVPLSAHERLLIRMFEHLATDGVCIFSMGGLDREEEKTDSAMGPRMYYSTLGIPRTLELVNRCGCVLRHMEFDQQPEQHLYLIVQRR